MIFLLINTSVVFSSWYDWSRYEHDGYSFKIPEGYKVSSELQADWGDDYLVEDWGYNDPGTRIYIHTDYEDIYDYHNHLCNLNPNYTYSVKEIRKYNDTATIYTDEVSRTIGEFKTDNGTTILICVSHHSHGNYTEDYMEKYADIIEGMFDSVRVD